MGHILELYLNRKTSRVENRNFFWVTILERSSGIWRTGKDYFTKNLTVLICMTTFEGYDSSLENFYSCYVKSIT